MNGTETVELSESVVARVKERVERTEFKSSTEYIEFILEEMLFQDAFEASDENLVDEQQVKERLESLGYLSD